MRRLPTEVPSFYRKIGAIASTQFGHWVCVGWKLYTYQTPSEVNEHVGMRENGEKPRIH